MIGYEQIVALKLMRDIPNLEGSVIARKADCSWDELFDLSKMGLIELGLDRIQLKRMHPLIKAAGLIAIDG